MKTAILISGHMRSFERCLPTLHWHVFRHFLSDKKCLASPASSGLGEEAGDGAEGSCCDFFVSTEPDADAPEADLLFEKYGGHNVFLDTTPQPTEELKDCASRWEAAAAYAPYAISVPAWQVLAQLWRLERCWTFHIEAGLPRPRYDLYIRCRPDLWMESLTLPVSEDYMEKSLPTTAWVPWWGRFGGVNDRFAILWPQAAFSYFTTYSQIQSHHTAGCPLHPESLVKASLDAAGCIVADDLDVSFSTLRANGDRRFPEIMAQDIWKNART